MTEGLEGVATHAGTPEGIPHPLPILSPFLVPVKRLQVGGRLNHPIGVNVVRSVAESGKCSVLLFRGVDLRRGGRIIFSHTVCHPAERCGQSGLALQPVAGVPATPN